MAISFVLAIGNAMEAVKVLKETIQKHIKAENWIAADACLTTYMDFVPPGTREMHGVEETQIEVRIWKAMVLHDKQQWNEVEKMTRWILKKDSTNVWAHYCLGVTLLYCDHRQNAIRASAGCSYIQQTLDLVLKDPKFKTAKEMFRCLADLALKEMKNIKINGFEGAQDDVKAEYE